MAGIVEEQVSIKSEGMVSRLEINRPDSLNALNADVLQGLVLAFEKLQKNSDLRVVVIRGAGEKAFVAGADIRTMVDLGPRAIADYVELGQRAMRAVETCRVPVIAEVNGYALGGGLELALACDLIFAASTARVGQPEVNLGIIPGFGGTQRLQQRCGMGAARLLVYSGEIISATEAHAIGLVDRIFESDALNEETEKFAKTIAARAPLAVQEAKKVMRCVEESKLLGGLRQEVEAFLRLFDTEDRLEGMNAFLEKRDASFGGS